MYVICTMLNSATLRNSCKPHIRPEVRKLVGHLLCDLFKDAAFMVSIKLQTAI